MSVCAAGATCVSGPARFHIVQGDPVGSGLFFFPVDSCSAVVARSGDSFFGCPGDAASSSDFGLPPGVAGVGGNVPSSIRFNDPTVVTFSGWSQPVELISADSDAGVAAGMSVGSVWSTGGGLAGVVAPGMAGLAAAALAVVLVVRWVRRTRRSI